MNNLNLSLASGKNEHTAMGVYFMRWVIRAGVDLCIMVSILFFNPWVTLLGVIAALFYFENYYEALAVGILYDMLYGIPLEKFFHIQWVTSFLFFAVYVAMRRLKRGTRFHVKNDR